jgi:hypothetical protein
VGRNLRVPAVAVLLAAGLSALIASRMAFETVDYQYDAGPAIDALVHLDPHAFFQHEPQMGALSLLLRWPFAALAGLWDGDAIDVYRLGAFACLLVAALVGLFLAREMHRRERSAPVIALALGLWLLSPPTLHAVDIGHPEELVGGALCVLAVLLGPPAASGVALGLALATKQWALVAVPATLLGSRNPFRAGAIALAVWLPLELPLVLGNLDAYGRVTDFGVVLGRPSGLWWPLVGIVPASVIESAARAAVLASAGLVSVLAWRRGGARDLQGRLALLALVLLLRALLDPTGNVYFGVPFLMALIALEGLYGSRGPFVSVCAATLLTISFVPLRLFDSTAAVNAFYLAWAVPLAAYLWRRTGARRGTRAAAGRAYPGTPQTE